MKKFYPVVCGLLLIVCATSCTKCDGEDPRLQVINGGPYSVSVEVIPANGSTQGIANIQSGNTSSYLNFPAGEVTFSVSVDNNSPVTRTITAEECYEYPIKVTGYSFGITP